MQNQGQNGLYVSPSYLLVIGFKEGMYSKGANLLEHQSIAPPYPLHKCKSHGSPRCFLVIGFTGVWSTGLVNKYFLDSLIPIIKTY